MRTLTRHGSVRVSSIFCGLHRRFSAEKKPKRRTCPVDEGVAICSSFSNLSVCTCVRQDHGEITGNDLRRHMAPSFSLADRFPLRKAGRRLPMEI